MRSIYNREQGVLITVFFSVCYFFFLPTPHILRLCCDIFYIHAPHPCTNFIVTPVPSIQLLITKNSKYMHIHGTYISVFLFTHMKNLQSTVHCSEPPLLSKFSSLHCTKFRTKPCNSFQKQMQVPNAILRVGISLPSQSLELSRGKSGCIWSRSWDNIYKICLYSPYEERMLPCQWAL